MLMLNQRGETVMVEEMPKEIMFGKERKRQLKKIASELFYDANVFKEIDAATTELEATQIMRRARYAM